MIPAAYERVKFSKAIIQNRLEYQELIIMVQSQGNTKQVIVIQSKITWLQLGKWKLYDRLPSSWGSKSMVYGETMWSL